MIWTQKEIDTLKTMWMEGKTAKEISPFVAGRREGQIWNKIKKLKIKRPTQKKLTELNGFKQMREGTPRRVKEYVDPVFTGGKNLVDLKRTECHYPYKGQIYCGDPTSRLHGYCDKHHGVCYK